MAENPKLSRDYLDFTNIERTFRSHADGVSIPFLSYDVERINEDDTHDLIGRATTRVQRVKRDETDLEDIEIVTTLRINPKAWWATHGAEEGGGGEG